MPVGSRDRVFQASASGFAPVAFAVAVLAGCATTTPTSASSAATTGTPSATAAPTATASPTVAAPVGWVVYHSTVNHVSFLHPTNWHPCEFNGVVTVVDNPGTACPTHSEGPAGTLTITSDAGQLDYSGSGVETQVTVAGIFGKCSTDTLTTPPPLDFGYRTTVACDVMTSARTYHLDFYGIPISTKPTATTQAQFNLFLETVTFDA